MITKLKDLEKEHGNFEFIFFGFNDKVFFRIIQTGKVIAVAATIIEPGIPDGVASRLKKAFPLKDERDRAELTDQIKTQKLQYTLVS